MSLTNLFALDFMVIAIPFFPGIIISTLKFNMRAASKCQTKFNHLAPLFSLDVSGSVQLSILNPENSDKFNKNCLLVDFGMDMI